MATGRQTNPDGNVAPGERPGTFVDPGTLMRIKNLQMRAKVVVEGFLSGLHRSPFHGFSVEFSEYRQYTPGDDLRYLDWRLYARSDRYYVKRFEDETNLRCYLLLDMSRSMGFGSAGYTKADYAKTAAATLAFFLALQRDAVGLVTFDRQIAEYLPARFRPGHLHRLIQALEHSLAGDETRLAPPIEQIAKTVKKRGMILLISDLLADIETLETQLGYLRSRGHEVVVMRVLDRAEVDFEFTESAMFADLESGQELYVDPAAVRPAYLERFAAHHEAIRQSCSSLGVDYYDLTTDQPIELALFDFLHARMSAAVRSNGVEVRRFARRPAEGPNEFSDTPLHSGSGRHLAANPLALDSPDATGTPAVQLADVPLPVTTPFDPPQPARQSTAAAAAPLAIGLLALAFARPFLREAANLSLSDARGRRVAIVLDTSASMRRGDVWQQAKERVEEVLDQLEPGDDVGLIAFDDSVKTLVELERERPPSSQKAGIVTQQVAKLEPSWGSTDLGQATLAAAEALRVANDLQQSDAALQIELISDLQEGAQIEALQAYEWPPDVALSLRRITPDKSSNAAVRALYDEESAASEKIRVRISNSAESAVDQFLLSWNCDEDPSPGENLAIYVPPGQSRIVNMARSESSHQATHLLIKGDDFPFDNRCFVTPLLKEELLVSYLGNDEADDPEGLRFYLELAFADTDRRRVAVSSLTEEAQLDFSGQSPPDLVVATSAFAPPWLAKFQDYIKAGGCGLVVARDPAAAIQLASLDERFQLSDDRSQSRADYAMLTEIDFRHPVFAAFSGAQYNDFTKIHFWKHTQFVLPSDGDTKILAQFDDGTPALWEQGIGEGKLFVLASGWDPESSTLARSSKFVPLLTGILDQAAGTTQPLPSFTVHEEIQFPLEGAGQPVVRTPEGEAISLDSRRPTFTGTVPGVYELQQDQQLRSFAVNLAARESLTAALDVEQLEQLGVQFGFHENRTEEIERQRQLRDIELEGRQKVWRWLIIAGLAVLGIETIVVGRLARKTLQ